MTSITHRIMDSLRRRGLNLPDFDKRAHDFGSPVVIPARPLLKKPSMIDIKGFDKRADREARWRIQGCLELEKLVPFMKNAGVHKEIVEHAEEVLRDLQAERRRKYPEKSIE